MDIPIFSIQNPILVNSPLLQFYEVPHADIWFSHFYLNVLQGTIAGFSGALPVLAREGEAKFWITLYMAGGSRDMFLKLKGLSHEDENFQA